MILLAQTVLCTLVGQLVCDVVGYVVGSTVPRIALGEKLHKGYEHAWENSLVNYSAAHARGTEALAVVVTIVPESNVISLYGGGHCMQLYVARGYPCVVVYYIAGLLECVPQVMRSSCSPVLYMKYK